MYKEAADVRHIESLFCGARPLVPEQTSEEKSRVEQLKNFIEALRRWRSHSISDEGRAKLRSYINDNILDVREAVQSAQCGITMTATPPPITGGLILRGLDPFDHIFDPPYGISVIPQVIDVIERTIARIRSGKVSVQRSTSVETARREKTHPSNTKVFLVHGHDETIQGLPLVWRGEGCNARMSRGTFTIRRCSPLDGRVTSTQSLHLGSSPRTRS
jgi:hypothetical protein